MTIVQQRLFIILVVLASLLFAMIVGGAQLPPLPGAVKPQAKTVKAVRSPRAAEQVMGKAFALGSPNTNRVPVLASAQLKGLVRYEVWTTMLETNAVQITVAPQTNPPPAPRLNLNISWTMEDVLMVFKDGAWTNQAFTVTCSITDTNDAVMKMYRVPRRGADEAVRLKWDGSPDANIAGYNIYFGPLSGNYVDSRKRIASETRQITISGLNAGGKYYFAATAFDTDGQESEMSNEVSITFPLPPEPNPQIQTQP